MRRAIAHAATGVQSLAYVLGAGVIALAVGVAATPLDTRGAVRWAYELFGPTFLVLFVALVIAAVFSWAKLKAEPPATPARAFWLTSGLQAANGIVALALAFTLLGISLGIAALAEQDLNPTTIRGVIRELTQNFSLAFMTTVVGLPAGEFLRALLILTEARANAAAAAATHTATPEASAGEPAPAVSRQEPESVGVASSPVLAMEKPS